MMTREYTTRRTSLVAATMLTLLGAVAFGGTRPAAAARVTLRVQVDGVERTALVDEGRDALTKPSPLVLAFHGGKEHSADMAARGLAQAWPEATVVYPQGLSRRFAFIGDGISSRKRGNHHGT